MAQKKAPAKGRSSASKSGARAPQRRAQEEHREEMKAPRKEAGLFASLVPYLSILIGVILAICLWCLYIGVTKISLNLQKSKKLLLK